MPIDEGGILTGISPGRAYVFLPSWDIDELNTSYIVTWVRSPQDIEVNTVTTLTNPITWKRWRDIQGGAV